MKLTLLILAAGMGSRYGGLKQLDPMGPAGETLLDYSVFDALRAGFDRVVFVIRRDFEAQFRAEVGARFERRVDVGYAFQALDDLPGGQRADATREKPWGTGQAIWSARDAVQTMFVAVNADDFYGRDAYRTLADFFQTDDSAITGGARFAMAGYQLDRTLSTHGSVSRGICVVDAEGRLQTVDEHTGIARGPDGIIHGLQPGGEAVVLGGKEAVSLNFWGFTPAVFPLLESEFARFLATRREEPRAEYYIPAAVTEMIGSGVAQVEVLATSATWFGVTYREDKPLLTAALEELTRAGEYPAGLWTPDGVAYERSKRGDRLKA